MDAMPMASANDASQLGMWVLMMAAMMLPSLVPTLWRYHAANVRSRGSAHVSRTLTVAAGYFIVWAVFAIAIYPLCAPLATLGRIAPIAAGVIVAIGGGVQLSSWKARQLECCRRGAGLACAVPRDAGRALRSGLRLGFHCCCCCAGITAMLLVAGGMSTRTMMLATAAITTERFAPRAGVARIIGAVAICAGLFVVARGLCSATL